MADEKHDDEVKQESAAGDELRIQTREAEHYEIRPASSARGGVQLQGDFLIEFCFERYSNPEVDIYEFNDMGVGKRVRQEGRKNHIMREKQTGVMMSQSNAFSVAAWIIADLLGDDVSDEDIEELIMTEYQDKFNQTGDQA
jgi:hypothetical protein